MTNIDIFRLSYAPDSDGIGFARAVNFKRTHYFDPFEFDVSPLVSDFHLEDGSFADFIGGDVFDIYSAKFKDLLEACKGPKDQLQWFPVELHGNGDSKHYFVVHIIKSRDIIDKDRSIYLGPRPYIYAFKNIEGRNIFCPDILAGEVLFVRSNVLEKITKSKITGVDFGKTNGAVVDE